MADITLAIDGQKVVAAAGMTILEAAKLVGIYIPALCHHPDLPLAKGGKASPAIYQGEKKIVNRLPGEPGRACGLCLVEVQGRVDLVPACSTEAVDRMVVQTRSDRVRAKRQENLAPILSRHRHVCLTCAQQEGCSRTQCSADVAENERCCSRFGHCELQDLANYLGVPPATPCWVPTRIPILDQGPLFVRDYNLCIGCTRCVRTCCDLRGVEAIGFVYDEKGLVQIGSLRPSLAESGCKFCTACVEVCPTGALMDKRVRVGRKAADLVPCREACPAHVDVPGYLRLIAQGRPDAADSVIREKVPLPGILGRVCIHPCEEVCRRGEVNVPIAICALKRYAADGARGGWKKCFTVKPASGRRVAVVGSGPAGLTAAFYLRKQGHAVTIFEGRGVAGGMMRCGIPPTVCLAASWRRRSRRFWIWALNSDATR